MDLSLIPDEPYLLLTPGPLTTTKSVRAAMLRDWCTWDSDYNSMVQEVREKLRRLATINSDPYTVVLVQGSGTFAVEAAFGSFLPPDGHVCIAVNGAYGKRMVTIAEYLGLETTVVSFHEHEIVSPEKIESVLLRDPSITHFTMVHCETTTGILNPLQEITGTAKASGKIVIVDAMSSFGGIPMDIDRLHIDVLVSSANKCVQGVPGFGFVLARTSLMEQAAGQARSLSLDLYDQWQAMEEGNGKWRFTSPTHSVYAFHQALLELEVEGGVAARHKRYVANQQTLVEQMTRIGFEPYVNREYQSPIITAFRYPTVPEFSFDRLYSLLKANGFVIYPGKLTGVDTFRIGTIGNVFPEDIERLVETIDAHRFW